MDITDVKDLCSRVGTNTTFLLSATLQVLRNIPERKDGIIETPTTRSSML